MRINWDNVHKAHGIQQTVNVKCGYFCTYCQWYNTEQHTQIILRGLRVFYINLMHDYFFLNFPLLKFGWCTVLCQFQVYYIVIWHLIVVQSLSQVWLFSTPWTAAHQAPLSSVISLNLLIFMSFELVLLSNHLILCHPLLLLPSIFPSIRVFSNESALHIRWPKYWSFSCSVSPSNEYLRLISFRIDWFDLLAIQGTLKSLLQLHNSKASILQCSAFFMCSTLTSIHDYWKNHSFD